MKFIVRDVADIPELGVKELVEAAKHLPVGKVIEVNQAELPYDKNLVLSNLIKASGQKFILHSINGRVLFEKLDGRKLNKPPVSSTPKEGRYFASTDRRVKWLKDNMEQVQYIPKREIFARMRKARLYSPSTDYKDVQLDGLLAIAKGQGGSKDKKEAQTQADREAYARQVGYWAVRSTKEVSLAGSRIGRTSYGSVVKPLVEKFGTVAVPLSLFRNKSEQYGFAGSLRNSGFKVEIIRRGKGRSFVITSNGNTVSSYWDTPRGKKELAYAARLIEGRVDEFKNDYPSMTGAELKKKYSLPDKSWSGKVAKVLGVQQKGIGWKPSKTSQQLLAEVVPA